MKAGDVMTANVVSVDPDASVQDVADVLLHNRISAVPVIDKDGRLRGIVSEGDLMRRPESGTARRDSIWLRLFSSTESRALDFIKSHSRKVTDVMTPDVVTVTPDTALTEVAGILERNAIKRVPVVQDGKVVGIVSRANLLQALASLKDRKVPAVAPGDAEIREKLLEQFKAQDWGRPSLINVTVQDGTVELWGVVDTQAERQAARVLAEVTPGVKAVNDNLMLWPRMAGA